MTPMDARDAPLITGLTVRACRLPVEPPLETAGGPISVAPLVLIDLATDAGVTGSAYLFTYTPIALRPTADLVRGLEPLVAGRRLAPAALFDGLLARFRLLGAEGLVLMAIAGVEMAAQDAGAKVVGAPLARLLGAEPRPIPAYASLRGMRPEMLKREVETALALGFTAFKLKCGWPDLADDLAAIAAVRAAAGPKARLMVDYNQSLRLPEARRRFAALDDLGLDWVEEPLPMNDVAGQAALRALVRTPLQGGENWWGPADAARSIAARATDHAMPDAMKIGGVTGWMRTAALAEAAGLPVSSHIFPEISAHLLAATPTAHLLEHFDLAAAVLRAPIEVVDGCVAAPNAPGTGVAFDDEAAERFAD